MPEVSYFTIFWVLSAISSEARLPGGGASGTSESQSLVDLTITSHWLPDCRARAVHECHFTSAEHYKLIKMEWVTFCNLSVPGPQCNRENEGLNLTIPSCANLKDKLNYSCTVQTDMGHARKSTSVMVRDCKEFSLEIVQVDQMQCVFCVNDSKGQVHWFHGSINVTSSVSNNSQWETPDGRFRISSTLPIQDEAAQYRCSLWLPNFANNHLMENLLLLFLILSYI